MNPTSIEVIENTAATVPAPQGGAFAFVTELAQVLSNGRVELPAFPEVAVRVRKVLADEHVSAERIARVVGSEAQLAARVFSLANSAALNRSGRSISELKGAINRIGHNNVRTAAVSFAVAQLRRAGELQHIAPQLKQLWQEATQVAALCYAVASRCDINADEAMLAGLLHNIGKLYILARANRHDSLFHDAQALDQVLRDWHANVGRAIVENWALPEQIARAVGDHESIERNVPQADVTDVLTVAVLMAGYTDPAADMELNMQGVKAFWRLGLDNDKCIIVLDDCAEELAALRSALGD